MSPFLSFLYLVIAILITCVLLAAIVGIGSAQRHPDEQVRRRMRRVSIAVIAGCAAAYAVLLLFWLGVL